MTDLPQDAPPRGVAQHNRQAHGSLPETTTQRSLHPVDATLTEGAYVADAYAGIFGIQPSTTALISPSRTPQYVAPDGAVLAAIDYRVELPASNRTDDRRVSWELTAHEIATTRLLVNGTVEARANGSKTPALEYTSLSDYRGDTHELAVAAEINVTVRKEIQSCAREREVPIPLRPPDDPNSTDAPEVSRTVCVEWNRTVTHQSETVTVRDTRTVRTYNPTVRGQRVQYPNGDTGLVVRADQPIAGIEYGDDRIDGVWRFFVTRADDWATMALSGDSGTDTRRLGLQPRRVHAYPSTIGVTTAVPEDVTVASVYGPSRTPPELPANVNLDVPSESYTATEGLAVRTSSDLATDTSVVAAGIVRATTVDADQYLDTVTVNRSTLTLAVASETDGTVVLEIQLRDAATGHPIATATRTGIVTIDGQQVDTTANGTARIEMTRSTGAYTARFEPAPLGTAQSQRYTASSDRIYVPYSLDGIRILTNLSLPLGLFLVAVFLIDRTTGWDVWRLWTNY